MKTPGRLLVILALVLMPAMSAMAQSTPADTGGEPSVFAHGLGVPATYMDERGNALLEVSVTEVERGWDAPEEVFPPEAGKEFIALHFSFTNLTSREIALSSFTVELIDELGFLVDYAWITNIEGVLGDEILVGAGETVEGPLVFIIYTDVEPLLVIMSPEYDSRVFIYLGE